VWINHCGNFVIGTFRTSECYSTKMEFEANSDPLMDACVKTIPVRQPEWVETGGGAKLWPHPYI